MSIAVASDQPCADPMQPQSAVLSGGKAIGNEQGAESQPQPVISEVRQAPGSLRAGCLEFKAWLAPQSYSEQGGSRVMSLDIMRGIGIFFMMLMHEVGKFDNSIDDGLDALKEFTGVNWLIIIVMGGLMVVFENFKSFFALISTLTMAYLFFYKCETLRYMQALKIHFFALFQSFAMSLLWFLFDQLEPILQIHNGSMNLKFPIHGYFTVFQQTPMFFGCALIWSTIFCIFCYWAVVVPYKECSKRFEHLPLKYCFWFLSLLSYLLGWLIHFIFTDVNQAMNRSLISHNAQYPTSNVVADVLQQHQECNVVYVGARAGWSLKYGMSYWVYYYVIHIISGRFMMLIPFLGYTMMGFAFGFLLVAFQYDKQESKEMPNEERGKNYRFKRAMYFVAMCCSCVISLIFYFLLHLQALQDLRKMRRIEYFSMSEFVETGNLWQCMFPEYSAYMMILEQCITVFCLFVFEARKKETACRITQKTLFLRRYSTLSFSIFLFQGMFSLVTKTLWGLHPAYRYDEASDGIIQGAAYKCSPLETIFYLAFYVLLGHFVMIAMEKAGDVFTVDWVFSRARHLLTPGKGKFKPLTNQHLNVKPINVFGIDEVV